MVYIYVYMWFYTYLLTNNYSNTHGEAYVQIYESRMGAQRGEPKSIEHTRSIRKYFYSFINTLQTFTS